MGRQNRELLENLRKYEEKKAKQQNPKYWDKSKLKTPKIKEKRLIRDTGSAKIYAVFLENDTN